MIIFSINKNYLSFVLIFDFSQVAENPAAMHDIIK
jgi:hypothetical protein